MSYRSRTAVSDNSMVRHHNRIIENASNEPPNEPPHNFVAVLLALISLMALSAYIIEMIRLIRADVDTSTATALGVSALPMTFIFVLYVERVLRGVAVILLTLGAVCTAVSAFLKRYGW